MQNEQNKNDVLSEVIKNGGFYGNNGLWNSIITFTGDRHIYRHRVETLIVRNGKEVFVKKKLNNEYMLPGGSTEKNVPNIDQAVNECREEAHINVKNIESTGITYKIHKEAPEWAKQECPVTWNGYYTEIYVAEYDSIYRGHIDKEDEDPFIRSGKFIPTSECFKFFRPEHREALKWYLKNYFSKDEKVVEESYVSNYFKNKKLLKKISNDPEVTKQTVDMILSNLKKNYSELIGKSKIQRERKRSDVGQIFHPVVTLDFSDQTSITIAICFDESQVTDGMAISSEEYGYIIVVYPKFFKENKNDQVFTLLHEIGHVRLSHLEYQNAHKDLLLRDDTNDRRVKVMQKGKAIYPEVNADLYAVLNGANLYTILNANIHRDYDDQYDYRFTNSELASRYNSVFKQYKKLRPFDESYSAYDIAGMVCYDLVYLNEGTSHLSDSDKDRLYNIVLEYGINRLVSSDETIQKAEKDYKEKKRIKNEKRDSYKKILSEAKENTDSQKSNSSKFVNNTVKTILVPDKVEEAKNAYLKAKKNEEDALEYLNKVRCDAYNLQREEKKKEKKENKLCKNKKAFLLATEKAELEKEIRSIMENVLDTLYLNNYMTESSSNSRSAYYIYLIESLSTKERNAIPLKEFGIPEERKYPLDTKKHVESAIRLFGKCEPKYREQLAGRILKAMKKFNIPIDMIGTDSTLYRYI